MGIVHLCRDSVKSAISVTDAVVRGEGTVAHDAERASQGGEYGQRAFAAAYQAVGVLLAAGASVVMDQAWHRGISEAELQPLVASARAVFVTAVAAPDVAAARVAQRGVRPGLAGVSETLGSLAQHWDAYLALDLDVPRLVVDTSNGYEPDLAGVEGWIWRSTR
jgi:predicted kinase